MSGRNAFLLTAVVMALALLATVAASGQGARVPNEPRIVGSAGPNGKSPDKVKIKTSGTGQAISELKNGTGVGVSGFHVQLPDSACKMGYKISEFEIANPSPFDSQTIKADGGSADAKSTATSRENLADQGKISVRVKVVDKEGNPVQNEHIEFLMHWTRWDEVVSNSSTARLGGMAQVAVADVVPDFNPSVATSKAGINTLVCKDIALGECYGYRFQNGSLVITPDKPAKFKINADTRVLAHDEEGTDMLGSGAFSAANLRIDEAGNFVFDITRDQAHDNHIVIVVRGLQVTSMGPVAGVSGGVGAGEEIHAGVSGAAVSGKCAHGIYHLVSVTE